MAGSIVVWGGPPYFGPANSTHEEMARAFRQLGNDVLYLELEGDAGHFRREARMNPGPVSGTAISGEGIIVARIRKLPLAPYAMVNTFLKMHMRMAIKQLRWLEPIWEDPKVIFVLYGWFTSNLISEFAPARFIYDCTDDHRAADGIEGKKDRVEHVWKEEQRLLASATLSTAVSEELAADRQPVARKFQVLPNAADQDWCKGTLTEPDALRKLPHPRALFLGNIGPKVDVEMLRAAAAADAAVTWILAGELLAPLPADMPSNVHPLGRIHHDDMAPIASHCDCAVAPLKDTAWNRASSPLKYYDYLAAGLPVVSTPIPAAQRLASELGEAVTLARSAEELTAGVTRAAAFGEDVRKACTEYAIQHTWQMRARAMLDSLEGAGS